MTEQPEMDYLYSGRKTVRIGRIASASELGTKFTTSGARYPIVASAHWWQGAPYVPKYDVEAVEIIGLLGQLAEQGRVQEV